MDDITRLIDEKTALREEHLTEAKNLKKQIGHLERALKAMDPETDTETAPSVESEATPAYPTRQESSTPPPVAPAVAAPPVG